MPPMVKAEAYVDLILAPDGETMLGGEAAMINARLGQRGFDGPLLSCTSEELEMVSAVVGLTQCLWLDLRYARDLQPVVRMAMLRRAPESLAALTAFVAFTPPLVEKDDDDRDGWSYEGSLKDPMSHEQDDLQVRECEFTSRHPSGKGAPYDCKETYLKLAPPQASECYCHVMGACLQLLLAVADPHQAGAAQAVRQLQASPAFVPCVQRLMELVSRWGEHSPLSTAGRSWNLPSLALEVLATLCASADAPRVRWLLRAHRVHERRYDLGERQWLPVQPRAEGGAAADDEAGPGGFFAVLFHAMKGTLAQAHPWYYGDDREIAEEDKRHASVLFAVIQGQHSTDRDSRGRLLLPPLPSRTEDADEVEEAFDAVAESQTGFDTLSDELAVCTSDEERVVAMLFFLDVRYFPPSQTVTLHGITSKPELNGKRAVIAGPRPTGKVRYPVRVIDKCLTNPAAMLLRPCCLRLD